MEVQRSDWPKSTTNAIINIADEDELLVDKPICLKKQGTTVLCDDLLKPGTHAGAISHMPPEMLTLKKPFYARAVDMWQCGLVMYELLTGRRAFDLTGHTPGDVIQAI